MPALPNVPNVLKATVDWHVEADALAQTIHYFRWSGSASAADLSSFANAMVADGLTQFQGLCSDQVGMTSATCRDLTSAMGNEATAGTPWNGTRGAVILPPAAAVVISHSIARHYRGGHPRTYLPLGEGGDVTNGGLWTTGLTTAAQTAWGAWVAGLIGGSPYGSLTIQNIVNVSYFGPPNRTITGSTGRVRTVSTVRAVPIVDTITGHVTRSNIGSQRRRNRDA
jgi:hypothetical protein